MRKASDFVGAVALFSLPALLAGCASSQAAPPTSGSATAATAVVSDLSGTWKGSMEDPASGGRIPIALNLEVSGEAVTGTLTGAPPQGGEQNILNGKLKGDRLSFDVKAPGPGGESLMLTYKGKISGARIEGTHASPMGSLSWEAVKQN